MWLSGPLLLLMTFTQNLSPLVRELIGDSKPYAGRTAREWNDLLKKGRDAEVSRAVNALVALGPGARVAVPTLKEVFEQGPPWQRRSVASALGSLGAHLPEAVEVLRQGMKHPNMTVRRSAFDGISRLDPASLGRLAPDLIAQLDEPFFRFRRNISEILERADLHPDQHLPLLLSMLENRRADVRRTAVTNFQKQPRRVGWVRHLLPLLQDQDSDVRHRALLVLCHYAGEEKAEAGFLVQGIQSEEETVRDAALQGMLALQGKARSLETELLIALDQSSDAEVRLAVAEALWRCCRHPRGKATTLTVCREGSIKLRLEALNLLVELARGEESTLTRLREMLLGKDARLDRLPTKPYAIQGEAVIPILEEALGDKRPEVRFKTLEILRDLGDADRPRAVRLLLTACRSDPDLTLQLRAALYLWGRDRHPAAAEYLALFLNDESLPQTLRRLAFRQIPVEGPLGARTVPPLLAALKSTDANVREWAADRLGGCTVQTPTVVEGLRAALADKDRDVREAAARSLRSFGPAAQVAVPDLLRRLDDAEGRVQREAILTLAAVHPEPARLVPRLVPFLGSPEEYPSLAALEGLSRLGPTSRPALPLLPNLLREKEYTPRKKAVNLLARLDLTDAEIAGFLIPVLDDPDDDIRSQAVLLLAQRQHLPPGALPRLRSMAWRDEGRSRLAAAFALWRHERHPLALAILRNGLKDASPESCALAIDCVSQLGPDARPTLAALRQLLNHKDSSLADAAHDALKKLHADFLPL